MTTRIEAGDPATRALFFETLQRVATEALDDPELLTNLLAAQATVAHTCLVGLALHEQTTTQETWTRIAMRMDEGGVTI